MTSTARQAREKTFHLCTCGVCEARTHFGLHWRHLDSADLSVFRVVDLIPQPNFEYCTWVILMLVTSYFLRGDQNSHEDENRMFVW
jgi:hypothetical protein